VYAPALSYAGEHHSPVQVVGIDPAREPTVSRLKQKVGEGTWLSPTPDADGYYEALIGHGVADALEVGIGDEIILISQGADGSVANDIFQVTGIVGTRTSSDKLTVYLPLAGAQEFLTLEGRVHEYALVLDDIDLAREVAQELQRQLPALTVSPWQEVQETFYKTMQSDKRGNNFTLGIILFIVFIGVLNTVLMSVLERTREFGVLKAIGSRPLMISTLITLETTILSLLSIGGGFILALPIIAFFTWHGIEMPEPIDLGGVQFNYLLGEFSAPIFIKPAVIVLASAIVISIPPGIRAARVSPTAAMRSF